MEHDQSRADFLTNCKYNIFAGECGLAEKGNHIDKTYYVQFLRLGLAFLRQNFEVPADCQLGLSWFKYIGEPFPVIALGWNSETTPEGAHEAASKMELAMREFNRAVDWKAIVSILNSHAPTA